MVFFSFFTCKGYESLENTDETKYTNVVFSDDGSSVTIYFDGGGGVVSSPSNRALSKSLAVLAHDFFEVSFIYQPASGSPVIARGSWELGEPVGISGVYRTEEGVDYSAPISRTPPSGRGTAIMFAGKKTDKTLLAVGALTAVDGNPISTTNRITTQTKSVSFELNALKAGAINRPITETSFQTNALSTLSGTGEISFTNTLNADLRIGSRTFPLFRFRRPGDDGRRAQYTIKTHSSTHEFDFYRQGIVQATNGDSYTIDGVTYQKVEKIAPKYTPPNTSTATGNSDPNYHYSATGETSVILRPLSSGATNQTRGDLFYNPIYFTIDTSLTSPHDQGEIFAITFQIPVYALSVNENPVMWFIRPGYDKYRLELDDGQYGNGGAILVGVGEFTSNPSYYLKLANPPTKQYYNGAATDKYVFNIADINVQFIGNGFVLNSTSNPIDPIVLKYYMDVNDNFKTNGIADASDIEILPGASVPDRPDRELTIIVEYYDSSPTLGPSPQYYYTSFVINVSGLNINFSTVPEANRYVVSSNDDLTLFLDYVGGKSGVFLMVLTRNFDIGSKTITNSSATGITIIITALKPDLVIGRQTGAFINFSNNGPVTLFFGKWPFNTPIMVGGDILHDEKFTINTRGTSAQNPGGSETTTMFRQGIIATANWNVITGPEVTITNPSLLQP